MHKISFKPLVIFITFSGFFLVGGCSPLAKKESINHTTNPSTQFSLLFHLDFKKADLFGRLKSNSERVPQSNASFQLEFWRKDLGNENEGPFVDPGLKVCIRPWMKMENGVQHGASDDQNPISIEFNELDGTFLVEPVSFSMAGAWELHVELCNTSLDCKRGGYEGCPDGTLIDQSFQLFIVH